MCSFIIFISLSINHHLNEDIWCQETHLPCRAKFASPEVYSVGGISIRRKYLQEEMSSPRLPGQASPTQGTVRFHRASFCPPSSVLSNATGSAASFSVLRNREPAVSCLQCSWKLQAPGTAPQELWWGRYPKNRHCRQTPEGILMCRLKLDTHQVRGILLNSLLAELLPALCGISHLPDNLLFWN